jgi:hypothetical protein
MARKFKEYDKLRQHLTDNKIPKPGAVATILLTTFVLNDGVLKKEFPISKKVCKDGEFKKWIKTLNQWIIQSKTGKGNWSQFKSIGTLINYVNAEKIHRGEIITKDELEKSKNEILELADKSAEKKIKKSQEEMQKEIEKLKTTMDRVINIIEPPANEEKRQKLSNGDYDHKLKLINGGFDLEKEA